MAPKRVELRGVPIDCVNMEQALDVVDEMVKGDRPQTVIAVNPEKIIKAQQDPEIFEALNNAGLLIPDGIGTVIGVRMLLGESINRVPGAELMPAICERSLTRGYRLFLFGAKPAVNDKAVKKLQEMYPGINIVGSQHGYVSDDNMPELIDRINYSNADVLFIALGSPRQEMWMKKYLPELNVKVIQGVGGTFDVLAGEVKRAPLFFRKIHLEWFYRLVTEPKRLARQTALPKFAAGVLIQKFVG